MKASLKNITIFVLLLFVGWTLLHFMVASPFTVVRTDRFARTYQHRQVLQEQEPTGLHFKRTLKDVLRAVNVLAVENVGKDMENQDAQNATYREQPNLANSTYDDETIDSNPAFNGSRDQYEPEVDRSDLRSTGISTELQPRNESNMWSVLPAGEFLGSIYQDITDSCCAVDDLCSQCGVIECWNSKKSALDIRCEGIFDAVAVNRRGSVSLFRSNLARSGNGRKAQFAKNFGAVLDFHCDHPYTSAYFHALVDCYLKSIPLIQPVLQQKISSVAIVFQPPLLRYMEILCRFLLKINVNPTFFARLTRGKAKDSRCVSDHYASSSLALTKRNSSWLIYSGKDDIYNESTTILRKKFHIDLVYNVLNLSCGTCDKIIVILRNKEDGRSFIDEADLLDALKAEFGQDNIYGYVGTESFHETVLLFNRACAVVGFHGAGLVNIVYSCPGTLTLEISTFGGKLRENKFESRTWKPWRSNKNLSLGLDIVWEIKLIEHHHLWPTKLVADDGGLTIKASNVLLTREHIQDIISRLQHHLHYHKSHNISSEQIMRKQIVTPFRSPPNLRIGFGDDDLV